MWAFISLLHFVNYSGQMEIMNIRGPQKGKVHKGKGFNSRKTS